MALSTSSGSITSQTNTQSPQSSAGTGTSAAPSSRVQPGTASNLLSGSGSGSGGGLPLNGTELSVVDLDTSPQAVHSASGISPSPQHKHHLNAPLLAVAIGLFLVAAIIFGVMSRSAKNTTN